MDPRRIVAQTLVVLLCSVAVAGAATLEVPPNGGDASGIAYVSGWKCPPNDDISLVIDGGAPIPVPSRARRNDTAGVCNNDGRNGYITQLNFNLLGDGFHTAVVRQNGVPFAQSTFSVTTFGTTFLTGAAGTYVLANFPQSGRTTTIQWSQGAQNFIIVDTTVPITAAQVRYSNQLLCGGFGFTSTLSANGYVWISSSGTVTQYLTVQRASLGPFLETNSTICGDVTYPSTFPLTNGRRYVLIQAAVAGNPVLTIQDEGFALSADELAAQAAAGAQQSFTPDDASSSGTTLPGVAAEGSGTFSVVP